MKRYTSKVLKSIAVFFLTFPFSYIVLAAILFNIPLNTCIGILLSPFYYVVCLFVVVTGYGLWEMKRWSWYSLILSQILLAYENALVVHSDADSHHKVFVFFLSILMQLILTFRIAKEIRVPYFFPKIRWWESNPRFKLSIPLTVVRRSGEELNAEILDLAMMGCFVKLRKELVLDEPVTLKIKTLGFDLQLSGTNVWNAQSTVTHPKGIGVKFNFLHRHHRRALRIITRRLKKTATFYRRHRYFMNQEEFARKLDELEKQDKAARSASV